MTPRRTSLRLIPILLTLLAALDLPLTTSAQAPATTPRTFELTIVGADDQPVQKAQFEVRATPAPKDWAFQRGTFQKSGRYGVFAETDELGRATFDLPTEPIRRLNISVMTPGFAPFWAAWNADETGDVIPERDTIRLAAGVHIGGVIVDDDGKPVPNVEVHPSIEYKKREGDFSQLAIGKRAKSDAEGRWTFESVPASLGTVTVQLEHPEFTGGAHQSLPLKDFTIAAGALPTRSMTLSRGLTVTGNVVDRRGEPLADAKVRGEFVNSQREAVTNERGEYRLSGCKPGRFALVATAKGQGPSLQHVDIKPGLEPVDFVLPIAHTIRVRMVDAQGKPVPKFRVFFQDWRGERYDYGLDKVLSYAGENGVWEWHEAPEDAVVADICPPGGMQISEQRLVARDEEYVFQARPALSVTGRVIDKITRKPIPEFRVGVGFVLGDEIYWSRRETFDGREGAFSYRTGYPRPAYQLRIEAPGYAAAETRKLSPDEGAVELEMELVAAEDISGIVLAPDGKPATGATVAVGLNRTQIEFRNGELREQNSQCDRRTTGADGRFRFPPKSGPFEVIVVHPAGSAWIRSQPGDAIEPIHLAPWTRVEGIAMSGPGPAAGTKVQLNHSSESYEEGRPRVSWSYAAIAAEDGTFGWDRVLPGEGEIARVVTFGVTARSSRSTYSHRRRMTFREGETERVTIGGTGRVVTGRFLPPEGLKEPADWTLSCVTMQTALPDPPEPPVPPGVAGDPVRYAKWWQDFQRTPEGIAYMAAASAVEAERKRAEWLAAAVGKDGSFRIDDVPAGAYRLSVNLQTQEDVAGRAQRQGTLDLWVTIPDAEREGDEPAKPHDLGPLQLKQGP